MPVFALVLLLAGDSADATPPVPNLDFRAGTLQHWENDGFTPLPAAGSAAVCSRDGDRRGRTALLHRAVVIPPGAGVLRCTAQAVRPPDCPASDKLDVALLAAGKRVLPRQARTASGLRPAPRLDDSPTEYVWDVSAHIGHALRIVLLDDDDRPGCHVWCGGFQLENRDVFEGREFGQFMVRLQRQHRLPPMARFDSPHFTALSNADDVFSQARVRDCETLYTLFWDHFRRRGFAVREPGAKLMVAVFDSQAGFEAYFGRKMSAFTTGVYDPVTNRLVTYDYGQNEAFLASIRQSEQEGRRITSQLDRQRYLGGLQRHARDFRTGANIGTMMHETAHQLSFNCGLLSREGDVAAWLAEGLACYCEPTADGAWQGIGAFNPGRVRRLAATPSEGLIPLRQLLVWDGGGKDPASVGAAYAQSWALFRMLLDERPAALRKYLELIRDRRVPDHRVADFQQVFGPDLAAFEKRFQAYLRSLVHQLPPER
jgi:Protein of unknown function (DUF1570)